jgi:hypothetical protein
MFTAQVMLTASFRILTMESRKRRDGEEAVLKGELEFKSYDPILCQLAAEMHAFTSRISLALGFTMALRTRHDMR